MQAHGHVQQQPQALLATRLRSMQHRVFSLVQLLGAEGAAEALPGMLLLLLQACLPAYGQASCSDFV